jgi:Flp pilus assembly protein TadD
MKICSIGRVLTQPGYPLKNTLAIVTLLSLLAGCAELQPQYGLPHSGIRSTVVAAGDGGSASLQLRNTGVKTDAPQSEDALPAAELTNELLFKLLSAEIAYQRGQWQTAYVATLSAAQQTRDPRLARRAAEIALSAKQGGEALAAIRLWRELAPNSDEATQYYLGFIVLSDNLESARPIFAQRLQNARPQVRSLMMFQIQRMLARAKDRTAAFAMLEDLLAPYKSIPDTHLVLAQGALANGDGERARAEARTALAAKPDSELAVLMLVQATPDKNDAAKSLASFLKTYPNARDVRVAYARILIEQKQYDTARSEFETLLKAQPNDLSALYALGMLSAQTSDLKSAEKYLTAYLGALAKSPDEERDPTQALLMLAQIAEERKDPEGALRWLAQIDSSDAYLGAQIKRAQIIAKRGDMAAARILLSELKPQTEREQTQIIVAEAQLLRDANQPAAALAVLEAAIKRFPKNTDLLYDYAMVAEKSNKMELMESTLRKVIELAPDNQHAYNALGYSLAERNIRLPEALTLIEKALQLAPEDPFIMDSMGWVQFRLGKLKEAEETLRRAYQLRPDPEIATHLGEVLWMKGQKEDAQKLWRDANTKDPQNDTLKSTLARLHVSL